MKEAEGGSKWVIEVPDWSPALRNALLLSKLFFREFVDAFLERTHDQRRLGGHDPFEQTVDLRFDEEEDEPNFEGALAAAHDVLNYVLAGLERVVSDHS